MKRIFLTLLVGASLTCPVLAQDNNPTPPPTTPPPHRGEGGPPGFRNLTPAERKQLMTDHEAALKANPDLATQEKDLREKLRVVEKQIDAAMIQADPSVAPIIAKLHADGPRKHKDGDAASSNDSDPTN